MERSGAGEEDASRPVKLHFETLLSLLVATTAAAALSAQTVTITEKPRDLVYGILYVPIVATEPVERIAVFINGVKWREGDGRAITFQLDLGHYIRRMRIRAVGYDGNGNAAGEDEMVVNDPRPPFRARLIAPREVPEGSPLTLSSNVMTPPGVSVLGVDFYVGEEKVATVTQSPYIAAVEAKTAVYARIVARASDGSEANDVVFFGSQPSDEIEVTLQQIPLSVASGDKPLRAEDLTLLDNGQPRRIEALAAASDQPLYVVLLIDYSESMLEELPVVKAAARQFAKSLLRPQDRIAVVGFNQQLFWLTGFSNDFERAAAAVDVMKPIGETHLYDSAIEVLYELQKQPGRRALVVLTDGIDQGSTFKLDHLIHYARYAGVPIYPIVKNRMLSRLMRFGIGYLQARRLTQVARDTGATYFIIQREAELPAVYRRIADELRQQYRLVFYSDPGAPDRWHPLAVTSRAGHSLRIPRGYFP
jgi:Ca-activated chloride channel family protein